LTTTKEEREERKEREGGKSNLPEREKPSTRKNLSTISTINPWMNHMTGEQGHM
jgi:hypothetical protein